MKKVIYQFNKEEELVESLKERKEVSRELMGNPLIDEETKFMVFVKFLFMPGDFDMEPEKDCA